MSIRCGDNSRQNYDSYGFGGYTSNPNTYSYDSVFGNGYSSYNSHSSGYDIFACPSTSSSYDDMFNPLIHSKNSGNSMFDVIARIEKGLPGSSSGSSSAGDAEKKKLVYTNKNECFDKLDSATLDELKRLEKQIKEAQDALNKGGKDYQTLRDLKKEYRKLENKLAVNGQRPSQIFKNSDYSLYTNLDAEEWEQITGRNDSIKELKKKADELKKEIKAKKEAAAKSISAGQNRGESAADSVSLDDQEAIKALEMSYQDLLEDISNEIEALDSCVKAALKTDKTVNFDEQTVKFEKDKAEKAKLKGNDQVAAKIADALFEKDGKPRSPSKEDVLDAIGKIECGYTREVKEAVVEYFVKTANGMTKDKFLNAIKTDINGLSNRVGTDDAKCSLAVKIIGQIDPNFQLTNVASGQTYKGIKDAAQQWDAKKITTNEGAKKAEAAKKAEPPKKTQKEKYIEKLKKLGKLDENIVTKNGWTGSEAERTAFFNGLNLRQTIEFFSRDNNAQLTIDEIFSWGNDTDLFGNLCAKMYHICYNLDLADYKLFEDPKALANMTEGDIADIFKKAAENALAKAGIQNQ